MHAYACCSHIPVHSVHGAPRSDRGTLRLRRRYNHVITGGNFFGDDPAKYASFDTFFHQQANAADGASFQLGMYTDYVAQFAANPHTRRSQLLVLKFEDIVDDPATAVKLLTTHYGLPKVLT